MDLNSDYTEDTYTYLLHVENKPIIPQNISNNVRSCIFNWMMKMGDEVNPVVVQTAQWYCDAALAVSGGHIPLKVRVIASFWIALKVHGSAKDARRLFKSAIKTNDRKLLLAAERDIMLIRLKFPTLPVIPQAFINYFSPWCDFKDNEEIELGATFICMTSMMVTEAPCAHQWSPRLLLQTQLHC